ncbi:MAG: transglycosylase domain-containing protein [Clostridia bacterium]|nr:transglycosylase domain-containing protein [Clostridia bacterium]
MKDFDNKDNMNTTRIDVSRRKEEKEKKQAERSGVVGFVEELISKIKAMLKKGGEEGAASDDLFVERRGSRPFGLELLFTVLKVMVVMILLLGCGGLGLVTGVAKAYVETTEDIDPAQLTMSDRTSYIYDKDGNLITTFAGMEYRDWADIEEIPDMLKNALISIEDVRFYKHEGVDYKRLFSAVINTLRNADTHGGSTITQQLIKNKVLSNEQSYKRKIKEAYLSLELEQIMEKDDILAAYMNDVYLGGSNYGFKTAAKDYFGKELSELTIRECAMLAGMVQKPHYTNPRSNIYSRTLTENAAAELQELHESGGITEEQYIYSLTNNNQMYVTERRTNVVLLAMYEGGFITREQYDTALNDTVTILEKSTSTELYDMPYFVEYGIRDIVTHLLEQREMLDTAANRTAIENELRTGGYHIYLTVDTDMQHLVQDTLANWDEYPSLANPSAAEVTETGSDGNTITTVQPQAAAVVLDYHTGELRAIVGGRNTPTVKKGWNRAYQSTTDVGSSIKPLAVYGPALDLGASPATILKNFASAIEGWDSEKGYPAIGDEDYIGPLTVRDGVINSLNVAAARTLLEYVGFDNSAAYLEALGVDPSRINKTGSGLALGATGITPVEMAAAYGAVAGGGEYKEPLSFTRVVDADGKVILDAEEVRDVRRVFKKSTAYMLVDILTDAVNSGTGTRAKISGMTVAGKTGTNGDYGSVYFAGMTPYYTGTVWIGHDNYNQKLKSKSTGGKYAAPLWQSFMKEIHEGLLDKPIIDESPNEIGLVKGTVCSVSGKLATDACYMDVAGHTPVTDWFAEGTVPTEVCDMHVISNVCVDSGALASPYCSNVTQGSVVLMHTDSMYADIDPTLVLASVPNAVYTGMTSMDYAMSGGAASGSMCSLHTPSWYNSYGVGGELQSAVNGANNLINKINSYLNSVQNIPDSYRDTLIQGVEDLRAYIATSLSEYILRATSQLQYTFDAIYEEYPPVGAGW